MVTRRTAKSKGSSFEYDCQHSLTAVYPQIYRTAERGFQRQFDLCDDESENVFECKRLAGLSWNQALKFYEKLESKTPTAKSRFLLFKSNRQPCLVFYFDKFHNDYTIRTFENVFGVPFEKHPSTRAKK